MFGFGHWEILIVLLVALLLFGRRPPSIAGNLGKGIRLFREGLGNAEARPDVRDPLQGERRL